MTAEDEAPVSANRNLPWNAAFIWWVRLSIPTKPQHNSTALGRGSGNGTGQAAQGLIVLVAVIQPPVGKFLSARSGPSSREATK